MGGEEEYEEPEDFDTIASIVTGGQQGAVSIIRLSGGSALGVAAQVFRPVGRRAAAGPPPLLESHRVYYGTVRGADGSKIDEVRCAMQERGAAVRLQQQAQAPWALHMRLSSFPFLLATQMAH